MLTSATTGEFDLHGRSVKDKKSSRNFSRLLSP